MSVQRAGKFRQKPRPRRAMALSYRVANGAPVEARTMNISVGGAFVITADPPRAGTVVILMLPADGDVPAMEIDSEVRWVTRGDGEEQPTGMGVSLRMSGEQRASLEARLARVPASPEY